ARAAGIGCAAGGDEQQGGEGSGAHGASQDEVAEVRGGRAPGRHGRIDQMRVYELQSTAHVVPSLIRYQPTWYVRVTDLYFVTEAEPPTLVLEAPTDPSVVRDSSTYSVVVRVSVPSSQPVAGPS